MQCVGGIFSCKGRGACPSCGARRMVEVAAHLSDAVLPPVPLRQWVLSLPKRLRPYLHHDPQLAGAILRVLLRAIQTRLRRTSPGAAPDARLGAISFLHRFGSALNPHFHFHVVVLDGLFSQEPDGTVRFHEATHLTGDDAHHLQSLLQRRILRLFQRRGLLDPATVDNMLTWQGSGSFSLDASVRIHGTDRGGRERLLRYCARPPLALERMSLEHSPGGRMTGGGPEEGNAGPEEAGPGETGPIRRVLYLPARPLPDGRSVLALSPLEFLAALARLIPPPRVHRHRYHGVLAPSARLRASVVALAREHTVALEDPAATAGSGVSVEVAGMDAATAIRGVDGAFSAPDAPPAETAPLDPARRAARSRWARLIARIYEVSPLTCPNCGAEMRILAFLTDPAVIVAILRHLDLPSRPPTLSPARGPPQPELPLHAEAPDHLDQTPAFDAAEPDPIPDFDFDQS